MYQSLGVEVIDLVMCSGLEPSVTETAMGFSSSPEGNWYNLLLYAPAVEEPGLAVLASKEARVAEDIGNPDRYISEKFKVSQQC